MDDCKSKCMETGSIEDGRRLMVSQGNGEKYKPGDIHKQCDQCLQNMLKEVNKQPEMIKAKFQNLKKFLIKENRK